MKNKIKIWWISLGCVGVGLILTIAGLMLGGHPGFYINMTGIHTFGQSEKPYVQEKKRLDEFDSMDISVNYADLQIIPSDGYYIEYRLGGSDSNPIVRVDNQKLTFKEGTSVSIGFNFLAFGGYSGSSDNHYVKLYVPKDQYFTDVKLKSDDGFIDIGDIRGKSMKVNNSYGNIKIGSFQGSRFEAYLSDGDLHMETLDSDSVKLDNSNGDCKFGTIKGLDVNVQMSNGDFQADQVDVTSFDAANDFGNVKLGLAEDMKKYDFDLQTEAGSIKLAGDEPIIEDDAGSQYHTNYGAKNKITVACADGDIEISN